ncbi:hypothetical protein Daus18300_002842 [Diaporthe australafricana]|uniref:Uncharacterized protein n=1 Tax=Diaporthe australafricana TaxID=127596 RepID=A0ABR3XKS5_9PEZI
MFSRRILFKPRGSPFDAIWQPSHGCHCSSGPKRFSTKFSEIPDRAETKEEYTLDGKKRLRELMQHNIGLNGELKPSLRTRDLTVHIAARHVVQWSDLNYFTTSGLAYAEAVCRRYVAHTAQPLWWRTQALSATARPVIRNKATARMNAAFKEALHNAGYDTQGRRLPNQQEKPGDEATKGLSGTVVIKSHLPVEFHKIPFKDLQEFCARAVKAVEEANRESRQAMGRVKGIADTQAAVVEEAAEAKEALPTRPETALNGVLNAEGNPEIPPDPCQGDHNCYDLNP